MPLFLLKLSHPNSYDVGGLETVHAFVVCARDAARAREVVIAAPVDELGPGSEGAEPWSRADQSECVRLSEWGPDRIVLRSAETAP